MIIMIRKIHRKHGLLMRCERGLADSYSLISAGKIL